MQVSKLNNDKAVIKFNEDEVLCTSYKYYNFFRKKLNESCFS